MQRAYRSRELLSSHCVGCDGPLPGGGEDGGDEDAGGQLVVEDEGPAYVTSRTPAQVSDFANTEPSTRVTPAKMTSACGA
jgi:hypothetical protein